MSENEADLFRFEVPTSRGKFVIIGPDTLPPDEAVRIGAQITRLIPLLVNVPEPGTCDRGHRLCIDSCGNCPECFMHEKNCTFWEREPTVPS